MDLKTGFYDGLLEGSSDQFVFVDGGEMAYGYNKREHFEGGRKMVKEEPIRMGLTKVPDLHRRKVKCAFGLWPDYYGAMDPDDPENSYFSPGRFQRAVNLALELSDGYVWFWGEKWSWWVEGPDDRASVPIHQGRKLHLYLPDVDGSVWLASNSCPRPQEMGWRYVGLEPQALRKPFVLTHPELATFFLEPGKPAVVVIKVMRHGPTGGIMAPIQVLAE